MAAVVRLDGHVVADAVTLVSHCFADSVRAVHMLDLERALNSTWEAEAGKLYRLFYPVELLLVLAELNIPR